MTLQQNNYTTLITQINETLSVRSPVFIAISGFGGSGKSTLAEQLRAHFNVETDQVIRLDHLYSQQWDGPGMLDQVDWDLLTQILKNAHAGKPLRYTGRGFRGESIAVDAPLPRLVIVEGIRLLQPELLPLFDLSVWIDCPQSIAIERAKSRDRAQGEDEDTVNLWDTDWGPKDKAYFEAFRPDTLADVLY